MDEPPTISILLLGDPECGKSTFLSRLNQGWRALMKKDISLLHDMNQPFVYDIRMYNRPYRLEFFDTASPEDYTLLQPNVVILCYDISNRKSLRSLRERWRNDVTRLYTDNNQNIPVVLLGLKRDLRTESGECIDPFEAHRMAQEMRCDSYMECSAVTRELIDEVMEDLARLAAKTTTTKGALSEPSCSLM